MQRRRAQQGASALPLTSWHPSLARWFHRIVDVRLPKADMRLSLLLAAVPLALAAFLHRPTAHLNSADVLEHAESTDRLPLVVATWFPDAVQAAWKTEANGTAVDAVEKVCMVAGMRRLHLSFPPAPPLLPATAAPATAAAAAPCHRSPPPLPATASSLCRAAHGARSYNVIALWASAAPLVRGDWPLA